MKNFRWESGRQDSGYSKMLIATAKFPIPWDFYILKYPVGSEIHEHVDTVTDRAHYRLNIIIKKPKKGGNFFSEKTIFNSSRIKLFRPDLYKHSLTRIEKGTRYVISIGWAPRLLKLMN
ncbi:MAG: 2OG-Fe(II) oxygenase [Candidatus Pacebacteria bacterium]|nr:2OG-Fe(II) oxygenase [Candidatus Paceibacterota bacterium]